ncbi:MAG: quinolinate synthase NadA [Planctomycetota bacterium]|jgi:quinolinate synthase
MSTEPLTVDPGRRPRPSVRFTEATAAIEKDEEIRGLSQAELVERIDALRKERNAIILAHNYQIGEIQDIADFVGDSLQLSVQASETDAPLIVFCGVHFMAETAAILSPQKRVLIPDPEAGCSLAAQVTAEQMRKWRAEHPDCVIVAYVNTDAAVKAEVDYCCTSSNAVHVVNSVPADKEILFVPDMFLGLWLRQQTSRKIHLWMGECHVHAGINAQDVKATLDAVPDANLLLHPECGCISQCLYALAEGDLPAERTHILSTGGMVKHARESTASLELVGTEVGMLHRLRKENPQKKFMPVREDAICEYMKQITLPKLYRALRDDVYEITVEESIADRARRAIDRMMACQP